MGKYVNGAFHLYVCLLVTSLPTWAYDLDDALPYPLEPEYDLPETSYDFVPKLDLDISDIGHEMPIPVSIYLYLILLIIAPRNMPLYSVCLTYYYYANIRV